MPDARTVRRWRSKEAKGIPRTQIAAADSVSRQTVNAALGARPPSAPTTRKQRNIRVDPKMFDAAARVAKDLNLTNGGGRRAGKGSVAQMIELIGAGHLVVSFAGFGEDEHGSVDD